MVDHESNMSALQKVVLERLRAWQEAEEQIGVLREHINDTVTEVADLLDEDKATARKVYRAWRDHQRWREEADRIGLWLDVLVPRKSGVDKK